MILFKVVQGVFVPDDVFFLFDLFCAFRFTESHFQHSEQSKDFQQRMNELKGLLSSTELEVSQWRARYDALMEKHQGLDITMTKLDNQYEVKGAFVGWVDAWMDSSFAVLCKANGGQYCPT